MNITRNNYEIWAIDYLEGNLITSQAALFMAFLADNPDLEEELDNIRDIQSGPENNIPTTNFNYLKKKYTKLTLNPKSFEEFCIAYHEGDLDSIAQENLYKYIGSDTAKQKLFDLYKELKVQPNKSIVFQNKKSLKQSVTIRAIWTPKRVLQVVSSIAAAILIFFVLNYKLPNKPETINTAQKSNRIIKHKTETPEAIAPEKIPKLIEQKTNSKPQIPITNQINISEISKKEVVGCGG